MYKYDKKTDGRRNKQVVNVANTAYFDFLQRAIDNSYKSQKPTLVNRKQDILVKISDSNSFLLDTKIKILNNKNLTNEDIHNYAKADLMLIKQAFESTQDSKTEEEKLYELSEELGDMLYKELRVAPIQVDIKADNTVEVQIKDYFETFGAIKGLDITQINVDLAPIKDFIIDCYMEDTKQKYEGMISQHHIDTLLPQLNSAIQKVLKNQGYTSVTNLKKEKKISDNEIFVDWKLTAKKDNETKVITFTDSAIYDALESSNGAHDIDYYAKLLIENAY
ncbi:TPA: hypothetical protein IWO58_000537 [Enterococcus faecium]|nr:hypothetical protein [Enterococcus faecium]